MNGWFYFSLDWFNLEMTSWFYSERYIGKSNIRNKLNLDFDNVEMAF